MLRPTLHHLHREGLRCLAHLRQHGWEKTLRERHTPVGLQFAKYTLSGVLSVSVFVLVVALGQSLLPSFFADTLAPDQRARHLILLHLAAFFPANLSAYLINRAFIFTPGRHHPQREILLFFGVAFLSFALGELAPNLLVRHFAAPNFVAHLSFLVSSALFNFAARKFLVFAH